MVRVNQTMLTDRVPVAQIPTLLEPWARWAGRPVPKQKLVANWAWRRELTGFPAPVSERQFTRPNGGMTRSAREYDVTQVLVWWLEHRPRRGGRPRR